jgi:hypothetical protein
MLEKFALSFAQALQPQFVNSPPRRSNGPPPDASNDSNNIQCHYCGVYGHRISGCPQVANDIAQGKVRRDVEGRVILSSGSSIPRNTTGRWLKDKVDEWHKQNPNQRAAVEVMTRPTENQQMIYEIRESDAASYTLTTADRIFALEQEILALRSKDSFDGVHVPPRKKSARIEERSAPTNVAKPPDVPAKPPITTAKPASRQQPIEAPTNTQAPVHPFRKAAEPAYRPPHERNFGAQPKPTNKPGDTAYRTYAPVQDPKIAEDVYTRSMNTPYITLSQQELLSLSPEVRQKVREVITPKRRVQDDQNPSMATAMVTMEDVEDEDDPLPFADDLGPPEITTLDNKNIIVSDPYETYLGSLLPGQLPRRLTVAKDSHSLRAVELLVNNRENVESIIDPGCQIIAMSEAICHDLGLAYDPRIRLNMQSANGEIDRSLGLARNVPCRLGNITLYLQIHVLRAPAYDILLGRPFDVLTRSTVQNYNNEDQTITIRDPNSNRVMTIPTIPRSSPRHRMAARRSSQELEAEEDPEEADFQEKRD